MTICDRDTLKHYFRTGATPTQEQFADLIDSSLNATEDGMMVSRNPDGDPDITVGCTFNVERSSHFQSQVRVSGDLIVEGDVLLENTSARLAAKTDNPEDMTCPSGAILVWLEGDIPAGWQACDGRNGRPNLSELQAFFNQFAGGIRLITRS